MLSTMLLAGFVGTAMSSSFSCEQSVDVHSGDGGNSGSTQTWNVQCATGGGIVALYDDDNGGDDIDKMKCRKFGDSTCGSFINYNDCEVLKTHGLEDGTDDASLDWNLQCSDGKIMVGLYDDDDNFKDIDKVKCCSVSDEYEVKTDECYSRNYEDGGSKSAGSEWATQCPSGSYLTAINAEKGCWVGLLWDPVAFSEVNDIKCCTVKSTTNTNEPRCASEQSYTTKDINNLDGGSSSSSGWWKTQCSSTQAMVGMYDDDDEGEDIDRIKCGNMACNPGTSLVNTGSCQTIKTHGKAGGSDLASANWNVQCDAGKVVVGIYDDNDDFKDIDTVKCCSVASGLTVNTNKCSAFSFSDEGHNSAGTTWNTQCPKNSYMTAIRGEDGSFWTWNLWKRIKNMIYFTKVTDIKCCEVEDASYSSAHSFIGQPDYNFYPAPVQPVVAAPESNMMSYAIILSMISVITSCIMLACVCYNRYSADSKSYAKVVNYDSESV